MTDSEMVTSARGLMCMARDRVDEAQAALGLAPSPLEVARTLTRLQVAQGELKRAAQLLQLQSGPELRRGA